MKSINSKEEFRTFIKELSESDSGFGGWHEPDQWDLTGRFERMMDHVVRTEGVELDNAGFWPENKDRPFGSILEMHVIISRTEWNQDKGEYEVIEDINIANLLEWAY